MKRKRSGQNKWKSIVSLGREKHYRSCSSRRMVTTPVTIRNTYSKDKHLENVKMRKLCVCMYVRERNRCIKMLNIISDFSTMFSTQSILIFN